MPDGHLDPLSRATFVRSLESLAEEFRGIYSLETIERFVDESIDRMSGARVVRRIRDDIDARVQQLLAELVPAGA
jgi:hypothetical protein